MPMSYDSLVKTATMEYVARIRAGTTVHAEPEQYADELLVETVAAITAYNAVHPCPKIKIPARLENSQVAELIAALEPIVRIACAGPNADTSYDLIGVYQSGGPDEGIYSVDEREIRRLVKKYKYAVNMRDISEIMSQLQIMLPRKNRTQERDLIAVNNGVFDYETKKLLPFSPDFVFLAKSQVNYIPHAPNPVIYNPDDGTDWDVESWMSELSDDPEVVALLWKLLGATIRPNVPWNKSAWLYSRTGNNGKGTLCALMRNLCGPGTAVSIPLKKFCEKFSLEPLLHASAIITDENDVGTYIDEAANLKAVVTGDVVPIERKYKTTIAFAFRGFMVQCLNEYPRVKDTSGSFYRRQLFVPFEKCFTGAERKYIKDDYLQRKEVLEYVLYRVLNTNYYELPEPDACKAALNEYKENNSPVRAFFSEFADRFTWHLLPYGFLYDLFQAWFKRNQPSGKVLGRNTFTQELRAVIDEGVFPAWTYRVSKRDKHKPANVDPKGRMNWPERLILEYQLADWQNSLQLDPDRRCTPHLADKYQGLERVGCTLNVPFVPVDSDD